MVAQKIKTSIAFRTILAADAKAFLVQQSLCVCLNHANTLPSAHEPKPNRRHCIVVCKGRQRHDLRFEDWAVSAINLFALENRDKRPWLLQVAALDFIDNPSRLPTHAETASLDVCDLLASDLELHRDV